MLVQSSSSLASRHHSPNHRYNSDTNKSHWAKLSAVAFRERQSHGDPPVNPRGGSPEGQFYIVCSRVLGCHFLLQTVEGAVKWLEKRCGRISEIVNRGFEGVSGGCVENG
jgi:hypothetical protein